MKRGFVANYVAEVVELVDTLDSKSGEVHASWGFESPPR